MMLPPTATTFALSLWTPVTILVEAYGIAVTTLLLVVVVYLVLAVLADVVNDRIRRCR